jgi:proteic killer suppression protein
MEIGMRFLFRDGTLERLYEGKKTTNTFSADIVKAFRKRMALILSAPDERDFYTLKSLHYEKLTGKRKRQRSMRLNDKWRLILEVEGADEDRVVVVVGIEDYH